LARENAGRGEKEDSVTRNGEEKGSEGNLLGKMDKGEESPC